MTRIDVLDKGYVKLIHSVGEDLTVVNSARASYEKESAELSPRDSGLINFLISNDHTSVLRHCFITFEFRAPLMVARQHFKYAIGSNFGEFMTGWNEASRRYINDNTEFYIPSLDEWRSAPENSKQGSGDMLSDGDGLKLTRALVDYVWQGEELYDWAIKTLNVAPEQARLFLPAYGLYVSYYWSASLQSVLHFLDQRLAHDSQREIQQYAQAVLQLAEPLFPVTFEKWRDYQREKNEG